MKLSLAKKSISALLALCMTVGFAPVSMLALETEEPTAEQEELINVGEIEIIPADGETLEDLENKVVEAQISDLQSEQEFQQAKVLGNASARAESWSNAANTSWYDANKNEFKISTAAQLAGLAALVNEGKEFGGKTIVLTKDVDLSGKEWTPIGNNEHPFEGIFDGQGHEIIGLTINAEASNDVFGLFGCISYYDEETDSDGLLISKTLASVKNLAVSGDIDVKASEDKILTPYIGGIAGIAGEAAIINCISSVNISGENLTGCIGGMIGTVFGEYAEVAVVNSVYNGDIDLTNGSSSVGGFIGEIGEVSGNIGLDITLYNCGMLGTINASGEDDIGAIIGMSIAGHISGGSVIYIPGKVWVDKNISVPMIGNENVEIRTGFGNIETEVANIREFVREAKNWLAQTGEVAVDYNGTNRECLEARHGAEIVPYTAKNDNLKFEVVEISGEDLTEDETTGARTVDFGTIVYGNKAEDKTITVKAHYGKTANVKAEGGFVLTDNGNGSYTISAPSVPVNGAEQTGKIIVTAGDHTEEITAKIVINPATLTVDGNITATGVAGAALSTANVNYKEVMFNGETVDGTWEIKGQDPIAANGNYTATFTPADTYKFNAVSVQATMTVSTYGVSVKATEGNFDGIIIGYQPKTVVYTITNVGNKLTGLELSLGNSTNFELTATGLKTDLEKGESTTFSLMLKAGATENVSTTVTISAAEMSGDKAHIETINVKVLGMEADPTNTTISSIVIGGNDMGSMSADGETKTITVDNNVTSIEISVTTENPDATVTVNGKEVGEDGKAVIDNLKVGENKITVKVTGADGKTEQEYTITITRKTSGGSSSGGGGGSSTTYKGLLLTDTATGISVAGEKIASTAKIKVTELKLHDNDEACKEMAEYIGGDKFIAGYDISLTPATTAMKGTATVTIPVKGAENGDVLVLHCKKGKLETIKAVIDNEKVVFTVDSFSPFIIVKTDNEADKYENPFEDVKDTDWFKDDVAYVYLFKLMNGTTATKFEPTKATSRAMLVTILWRLEGEPGYTASAQFDDVAAGQWYTDGILWAASNGIVNGYSEKTFGPNDSLTREQMAAILYRYAQFKGYDVSNSTEITSFADNASVSAWAVPAVKWAVAEKLITGTATGLMPAGEAQRAQTAAILHRFVENIVKEA